MDTGRHHAIASYTADVADSDDTEIADVGVPWRPLFVEVEGEVEVQVMLDDGFFHREMDHTVTACGEPIARIGQWRRAKKYDGNLCPVCYTPGEVERAEQANAAELKHITGEHEPMTRTGDLSRSIAEWLAKPVPPAPAPRRRTPSKKDKP